MSQLIQMRQRIKTIETIKKITHAMRLIAMSSHTHLKSTQTLLLAYKTKVTELFDIVHTCAPKWHHHLINPPKSDESKPLDLLIIVGSQKGLCGNFNTTLLNLCRSELASLDHTPVIITVGKRAYDFVTVRLGLTPLHYFNTLTAPLLSSIAKDITRHLMNAENLYYRIRVVSTISKSFFSQSPRITQLLSFQQKLQEPSKDLIRQYTWDQEPTDIMPFLLQQYVSVHIQHILLESMIAEAAARFISMDSSTRNAKNMLDSTKLQYNKLRQAKITKELIELSSSME
jgi:F-type H+-transporting ATPase subunit gamma